MRKRRRLFNKMTIILCAVLVVFSAFFHAPMEVDASDSDVLSSDFAVDLLSDEELSHLISADSDLTPNKNYYSCVGILKSNFFDLVSGLESDSVYAVDFDLAFDLYSNASYVANFYNAYVYYGDLSLARFDNIQSGNSHHREVSGSFLAYGSQLKNAQLIFGGQLVSSSGSKVNITIDYDLTVVSCTELSFSDSSSFQDGYDEGYDDGLSAGYGSGYSDGYSDGESSVDTDSIYDEAFEAGKDSVDIQSYYDAGYQAGYQVAYKSGYEDGYDLGYQNAMDRIESWGADKSDYPIEVLNGEYKARSFSCIVKGCSPFQYEDFNSWSASVDFNPNHTYMFDIDVGAFSYSAGDALFIDKELFYLDVGGISYLLSTWSLDNSNKIFVPGDRMTSSFAFVWRPIASNYGSVSGGNDGPSSLCSLTANYGFKIYDMGPSGDTQNHIANQTDQLINGFDGSKGNDVNNNFSSGLNDFQSSEDSLWSTATTGLKDFAFFDFSSVPAMVTGMSFVTAIMGSWFNQAGGTSGVGIVLSILFSVVLVAMVLGLYRWYQSRGGKN